MASHGDPFQAVFSNIPNPIFSVRTPNVKPKLDFLFLGGYLEGGYTHLKRYISNASIYKLGGIGQLSTIIGTVAGLTHGL